MKLRDPLVACERGRRLFWRRPLSRLEVSCCALGALVQSTPKSNSRMTTDSGTPKSQRIIGISRSPFHLHVQHTKEHGGSITDRCFGLCVSSGEGDQCLTVT